MEDVEHLFTIFLFGGIFGFCLYGWACTVRDISAGKTKIKVTLSSVTTTTMAIVLTLLFGQLFLAAMCFETWWIRPSC